MRPPERTPWCPERWGEMHRGTKPSSNLQGPGSGHNLNAVALPSEITMEFGGKGGEGEGEGEESHSHST